MNQRINNTLSPDKNYRAWINITSGVNSTAYELVIRNLRFSLFKKSTWPRTRKKLLGLEYYDSSSQFQKPNLPIGLSINPEKPIFSQAGVKVNINYKNHYAGTGRHLEEYTEVQQIDFR